MRHPIDIRHCKGENNPEQQQCIHRFARGFIHNVTLEQCHVEKCPVDSIDRTRRAYRNRNFVDRIIPGNSKNITYYSSPRYKTPYLNDPSKRSIGGANTINAKLLNKR